MPELPEVETVRRGLNRLIKGKTIKDVNVLYDKMNFAKNSAGKNCLMSIDAGNICYFAFQAN